MVEILLTNNAQTNVINSFEGTTALHKASQNGHDKVVEILLINKAEVDYKLPDDATAILLASQQGHLRIAQLLISLNQETVSLNQKTALSQQQKAWIFQICWKGC